MADMPAERKGYVAECFWPGVSAADVKTAEARARDSVAALAREGEGIAYLGALMFPGDEVVFFEFDAASMETVRRASESAALPFERIVESVGPSARPPEELKEAR
jgi:hypothetical protein